jgi:hypothetical protein
MKNMRKAFETMTNQMESDNPHLLTPFSINDQA